MSCIMQKLEVYRNMQSKDISGIDKKKKGYFSYVLKYLEIISPLSIPLCVKSDASNTYLPT